MKLYYAQGTVAAVTYIALREAGIDFTPVSVDFASGEQTGAAYHQINPKGRVPALVLDDGTVLTETGALLEFVAESAPESALMPSDPVARARVREVMYYIASTMHVNHAHKHRGVRWARLESSWADMQDKVQENMQGCCEWICGNGLRGTYVLGEQFSIADCYLFVACTWLEGDGVDVAAYPPLAAFMAAMEGRDSVKAARAEKALRPAN